MRASRLCGTFIARPQAPPSETEARSPSAKLSGDGRPPEAPWERSQLTVGPAAFSRFGDGGLGRGDYAAAFSSLFT